MPKKKVVEADSLKRSEIISSFARQACEALEISIIQDRQAIRAGLRNFMEIALAHAQAPPESSSPDTAPRR